MSDSKSYTSFSLRIWIYSDSHLPPIDHDHLKLEAVPLSDDFQSEWVFGESLEEGNSSSNSLYAIFRNAYREVNSIEVPMPPPFLTEEEKQAS